MERPEQLVMKIGRQFDGVVFELDPRTRAWLDEAHPDPTRPRSIMIGHDTRADFDALRGGLLRQVATLLTGLDEDTIADIGGFRVYDPAERKFEDVR